MSFDLALSSWPSRSWDRKFGLSPLRDRVTRLLPRFGQQPSRSEHATPLGNIECLNGHLEYRYDLFQFAKICKEFKLTAAFSEHECLYGRSCRYVHILNWQRCNQTLVYSSILWHTHSIYPSCFKHPIAPRRFIHATRQVERDTPNLFGIFLSACDENQNCAHWELFATRYYLYSKSNIFSFFHIERLHISASTLSDFPRSARDVWTANLSFP
jgi:hypothetical protein